MAAGRRQGQLGGLGMENTLIKKIQNDLTSSIVSTLAWDWCEQNSIEMGEKKRRK
jgi:hypothetical protein